jgi:uncharacterized protein (TIGR03435 family)
MTVTLYPDRSRSPLRLRWRAIVVLFAALLAGVTLHAQITRPKDGESVPFFEVATVKPNNRDVGNSHREQIWWNDSSYRIQNLTLRRIIRVAYGAASDAQLTGGPDPLLDSRWDVNAKIDDNDYSQMQKLPRDDRSRQLQLMLQALLADRFQLKVHIETKTLPLFDLVVAKGGAKLQPSPPDPPAPADSASANPASANRSDQHAAPAPADPPAAQRHQGISVHSDSHKAEMTATEASLDGLINTLANRPEIDGRLVVDKTGLTGKFDWTMHWQPQNMSATVAEGGSKLPVDPEADGPSLFTALKEQLGLELKSEKGPVEIVVVDSADPPSPN